MVAVDLILCIWCDDRWCTHLLHEYSLGNILDPLVNWDALLFSSNFILIYSLVAIIEVGINRNQLLGFVIDQKILLEWKCSRLVREADAIDVNWLDVLYAIVIYHYLIKYLEVFFARSGCCFLPFFEICGVPVITWYLKSIMIKLLIWHHKYKLLLEFLSVALGLEVHRILFGQLSYKVIFSDSILWWVLIGSVDCRSSYLICEQKCWNRNISCLMLLV